MPKKNPIVVILLFVIAMLCQPLTVAAQLQPGDNLPDLSGKTIDGDNFRLSSLKGEPIILKIGTTWCPSCRIQTKTINGMQEFLEQNNIHFVDVFIQENEKTVRKYFSTGSFTLPETIILDNGEFHKKLNVYVIPRVILIDKDFKVYLDGDTISEQSLKKHLQAILDKK